MTHIDMVISNVIMGRRYSLIYFKTRMETLMVLALRSLVFRYFHAVLV